MHSITKIALIIISKIKNFVKQSILRIRDKKIKASKCNLTIARKLSLTERIEASTRQETVGECINKWLLQTA